MEKCHICFDELPVSGSRLKCHARCDSMVCLGCADALLSHCETMVVLPECVSTQCKGKYLVSNFNQCEKSFKPRYEALCYKVLSTTMEVTESIRTSEFRNSMIEKIRAERVKFINEEFPEALRYIIHHSMKSKLKKISTTNKKQLNILATKRKCLSMLCSGMIHPTTGICTICEKEYCQTCDMVIKTKPHECNPDDLESKKMVDGLVKCPSCHIPAIRSYGCNHITCAVCKTNFDYETGKKTSTGNHDNTTVVLKQHTLLSLLKDETLEPESMKIISRLINEYEPPMYSRSELIRAIKEKNMASVAKLYQKEIQYMAYRKLYTQCVQAIWNDYDSTKTVDIERLQQIDQRLGACVTIEK